MTPIRCQRQVLSKLGPELVTYTGEKLPETPHKQDAIAKQGKLVELVRIVERQVAVDPDESITGRQGAGLGD